MASGKDTASPELPGLPPASSPVAPEEGGTTPPPEQQGGGLAAGERKENEEEEEQQNAGGTGEPEPGTSGTDAASQALKSRDRGKTCRILFAGKGIKTWDKDVRRAVQALNTEQTEKKKKKYPNIPTMCQHYT